MVTTSGERHVRDLLPADFDRPHKGPSNYEASDADLFFGREAEAAELVARILGSRLSVLYAPSGAGKTSLLNARVRPMLEARGWSPIPVRFGNEPVEAVRAATLRYLFPPLSTELQVLSDAVSVLKVQARDSLGDLLDAYRRVPLDDPRRRALLVDREDPAADYPGLLSPFKRVSPYLCRILRGSVAPQVFSDHLHAVILSARDSDPDGSGPAVASVDVSNATSLTDLETLLASDELRQAQSAALATLYLPLPGLDDFFENLVTRYGARRRLFQIVLILDQFEEIFTRYRDPGRRAVPSAASPDWRHRTRFFQQLENLFHARMETESQGQGEILRDLPIRYVLSLREEYVGRLDRVRLFVPDINSSTFRLGLLSPEQTRRAILGPAHAYRYGYSPSVLDEVWEVLSREETVAPGTLSIVCDQLWDRIVKKGIASVDSDGGWTIDDEALARAGLTQDGRSPVEVLIAAYFGGFVDTLPADERVDVLDVLELLITGSGTRNIVAEHLLVHAPFRSTPRRQAVLDKLIDSKLLRREERVDGSFVEITHEILIAPMQVHVQAALRESRGLRGAERTLDGIRRGDEPSLDPYDFAMLDAYETRFEWPPWAVAVMLESAVAHGAAPERLRHWARAYESAAWPTEEELLALQTDAQRGETLVASQNEEARYLALEEARVLAGASDSVLQTCRVEQLERMVRSLIHGGGARDRHDLARWIAIWNARIDAHHRS